MSQISFSSFINDCFDPVELILILSLREKFKSQMEELNISALHHYIAEIRLITIRRLDFVLDINIKSVERISIPKIPEKGPHYVT